MKTINLSSPPWWFIVGGIAAYALAIAYTPLQYLWWVTQGAPQMPMVPPQIAYVGGYKDAIMPTLAISVLMAIVWFIASFARQSLHNLCASWGKRRDKRAAKRASLSMDSTPPARPVLAHGAHDPGQLVNSWVTEKAIRTPAGVNTMLNLTLVRRSFNAYCRKHDVVPPPNPKWLPRRLRQLGFSVEVAPRVKGDKSNGNRYVFGLALK